MNVRFSEACRTTALKLEDTEHYIEDESIRDGRTREQLRLSCAQDIYIGVFFDGTNNNKYRDTPGFAHSNVARLYEVFPGMPANQTAPKLLPKMNPDGSKTERPIFADRSFRPSSVQASELPYYRKIYVPGVGTPMPDVGDSGIGMQKTLGLSMASIGQARMGWAMLQLCQQVHAALTRSALTPVVDITKLYKSGTRRPLLPSIPLILPSLLLFQELEKLNQQLGNYDEDEFNNMLAEYEGKLAAAVRQYGSNNPSLRKIRLSVFGFSRGAAKARAWVNMIVHRWGKSGLAGIPLQMDFLGIFDTVASVGLAQSMPYSDGHFSWADGNNLAVPGSVRRCVHLVAAFEVRGSFPLDSVCQGEELPARCKEIVYPGVHSDVGGGYPPSDQGRALGEGAAGDCRKLSQISLAQMYREARMAGVPLAPPSAMLADQARNFAIHAQLREDFNAYIAATRTGHVVPTRGRGNADFARMFPTETQPRDTVWRVIRAHHGYLLQWRKAMLLNQASGGAAGLPGLHASTSESRYQDIEDLRGAESELRKEVAFLQSTDPGKFERLDDPFLEKVVEGTRIGAVAMRALGPVLGALGHFLPKLTKAAMQQAMREKQQQWDTWLRRDWAGEGALPKEKAEAAARLFENYVHDSRAWFKPLLRSDGQGMAPDDEVWFSLGGREAERNARIARLERDIQNHQTGRDMKALEADQQELHKLRQKWQPLIVGAREPYRQWGYLRHRRIYQSGQLIHAGNHAARQQTIDREEWERQQEERRSQMIAEEKARHEQRVKELKAKNQEVLRSGRLTSQQEKEYMDSSRSIFDREMQDHMETMRRLQAQESTVTE